MAHGPGRSSPLMAPRGATGQPPPPEVQRGSAAQGASSGANRDLGSSHAPTAHGQFARSLGTALQGAVAATLHCPSCRAGACGPQGLCRSCAELLLRAVEALPAPSGDTLWLGPHAGIWRRLVHALKYRHSRRLASFLAQLLHLRLARWGWQPQVMTHVPTTAIRRKQRSYDQAELLAAALAHRSELPHLNLLQRQSSTAKLVGQGRAARAASLAQAFTSRPLAGRSVLLVDDVLTTGASLSAARAALEAAGAGEIRSAVVARTAPSHEESAELTSALALLEPAQQVGADGVRG